MVREVIWSINGVAAVLGSTGSDGDSVVVGFNVVSVVAGVLYIGVIGVVLIMQATWILGRYDSKRFPPW